MSKLVRASKPVVLPKEMIDNYVQEYSSISAQIKKLEERKKSLAGTIKLYAQENGVRDDKGNFYCENDTFVYGMVAKSQTVPRKDIIDTLKMMGREDCIDTVEVANIDAINKCYDDGILSDDDIKRLFEVKFLTPSVSVKEKKEMATIEQKAASKKR